MATVSEYRSANGRPERLLDLATELVRLDVDVIVTRERRRRSPRSRRRIPIVMASSGDPTARASCGTWLGREGTSPVLKGTKPAERLRMFLIRGAKELRERLQETERHTDGQYANAAPIGEA